MFKSEAAPQKIFNISARTLRVTKALGVTVQLPVDPSPGDPEGSSDSNQPQSAP